MNENAENITVEDAEIEAAWAEETADGAGAAAADQPLAARTKQEPDQAQAAPNGAPTGAQRSGSGGERTSAGVSELSPQAEARDTQAARTTADQPPELFTLNHLGETRQVTRAELTALAQKGMDYERVRGKYDALKQYKQEAGPALELIRGYAQRNNMSVAEYLDFCRKQELMAGGLDEQTAASTLSLEKREAAVSAQEARAQAERVRQNSILEQAKARQEAQKKDMEQFIRAFPEVKAKDIPAQVWERVRSGESLSAAWTAHQNQLLKAELEAERQNRKNQQNAIGSLESRERETEDQIDRWWNEED